VYVSSVWRLCRCKNGLVVADPPPWRADRRSIRQVEKHYRRYFEGHESGRFDSTPGPIGDRLSGLEILRFGPGPRTETWVYATLGASAVRSDAHGTEFFLLSPDSQDIHCETLTMTAFYHAGEMEQRLGLGHTVPIGRPWCPGSMCDHLLVSLPYPFGPALEECTVRGGHVQVLWLLPITESERDFKAEHGLEALEERFEEAELEYWNPTRKPTV